MASFTVVNFEDFSADGIFKREWPSKVEVKFGSMGAWQIGSGNASEGSSFPRVPMMMVRHRIWGTP